MITTDLTQTSMIKKILGLLIILFTSFIMVGCVTKYKVVLPKGYVLLDDTIDLNKVKKGQLLQFRLPNLKSNEKVYYFDNILLEPNSEGVFSLVINYNVVVTVKAEDVTPPVILIDADYKEVTITVGTELDIMAGVRGLDAVDGDITDKITYNLNGFDKNVVGEYKIIYFLVDSSLNSAKPKEKKVRVINQMQVLKPYDIYHGAISNELKPGGEGCFQGAYYHKVRSSKDSWKGIEGTLTIPTFKIDRYQNGETSTLPADYNKRNLDNPSIYMGGTIQYESDVGMFLAQAYVNKANSPSIGSIAFRPFWRYITNHSDKADAGPYDLANNRFYSVSATGNNYFGNYHPSFTQYYYLPGDKIRMVVFSPKKDYLQLQIEVLEKSKLEYSVNLRREHGWKDPENFVSPMFHSPGAGHAQSVFKRVNAIDIRNNEGKPVPPTTSYVDACVWESSFLHRIIDGKLYRIPFKPERAIIRNCPDPKHFENLENLNDMGGEIIAIKPKP